MLAKYWKRMKKNGKTLEGFFMASLLWCDDGKSDTELTDRVDVVKSSRIKQNLTVVETVRIVTSGMVRITSIFA